MWFKRRRQIAVDDVLAILEKAKELMAEGAEIRAPIKFSYEDEEEAPPSLSPEDAEFITTGGTFPDYGEDEEDDEDA